MTTLEKIKKLTDRGTGMGIPMTTIARFCRCHWNAITYYTNKNHKPKPEVLEEYEEGLQEFLREITAIINDTGEPLTVLEENSPYQNPIKEEEKEKIFIPWRKYAK